MILSFKQIVAVVVLVVGGVSGVMAQQPAPAAPPVRVVQYNGDFTMLLAALPGTYDVTMGLELDTQRSHVVTLSLMDATVADVLNAVMQSSKKYQWRQNGEVIDVWPLVGANPLLETKITSFKVKDVSPLEAFDQLFNLPEVKASMTGFNMKRRAPEGSPAKLNNSKFSVDLEGVTLREALNKIALESKIQIWIFRNYPNGFFSISSIDR